MVRLFVAVVLMNVAGAAWWAVTPAELPSVLVVQVEAPSENDALVAAWERAEQEVERRCGAERNVVGVEEVAEVSNGYQARVSVNARCGV